MRRSHLASLATGLAAGALTLAAGSAERRGIRAVPADQAAPLLDQPDVVVLDIRTPAEVAQARLPRAVNLDYYAPDFAQRLSELDRDATYLMYCRSGSRSGDARGLMTQLGFTDVTDVEGGIIQWANAGLPLER